MSKLAQQLIAKGKKQRTGMLDLGRCRLTDLKSQMVKSLPFLMHSLARITHL